MKEINLFLMNMANADNITGVERYLNVLTEALAEKCNINVTWIQFTYSRKMFFIRKESCNGYIKITVPLPQTLNRFLTQPYCIQQYNKYIYHLLAEEFKDKNNCIIHLNTLNLIDFALYLKQLMPCKIISHLHCIPWKSLYNTNRSKFNYLYQKYYLKKDYSHPIDFVYRSHEYKSYTQSDCVICVTECAKNFITNVCHNPSKIKVVYNGIKDSFIKHHSKQSSSSIKCLYVGNLNESKGLNYITQALQYVQKTHNISLTIVGKCTEKQKKEYCRANPNLVLHFTGLLSFEELKYYYITSDIGLIASLQEQCSYVAIEMMMFGLPIVTTNVDGLDELFSNGYNALKIVTSYSSESGLSIDISQMSEKILKLIKLPYLRRKISKNARECYLKKYTVNKMVNETIQIYQNI